MRILLSNIKTLLQVREDSTKVLRGKDMNSLPVIENAYLIINDDLIESYGSMSELPRIDVDEVVDCTNQVVGPGYVDSHTHLVFAATREREFEDRIDGLTYEEIAARGGGILNSAAALAEMTEDELFEKALKRLHKLTRLGTTSIEIKSGYGLTVDAEVKMLRVIKRLRQASQMQIKATFLGAHAIPKTFKNNRKAYIDSIINEMLPVIGDEKLADYVDVFCEKNYFTVEEMIQIIKAGANYGLKAKVHVNQFNSIGAIEQAIAHDPVSVDHLEIMTDADFNALENSNTIATALPSCSFFLGLDYAPVKEMLAKNIAFNLATDYNPGSTPSGNMNFVYSLGCIKMGLTIKQAYNAITYNAAHALEIQDSVGSITVGKKANLIMYEKGCELAAVPYHFGNTVIDKVMLNGKWVN